MSDNSKLSAASWLVGPSRHAGIGKAVKWGHVHIVFPLDSWIFVSVSVGLFQDPGQNSFLVTRIIGKFWYLIHRLLEHLYFWFLTYPWSNYPNHWRSPCREGQHSWPHGAAHVLGSNFPSSLALSPLAPPRAPHSALIPGALLPQRPSAPSF